MDHIEITYRGLEKSEAIDTLIRQRIDRLTQFCDRITSCYVAVERPHRHETHGSPYRVRVECKVPPNHTAIADQKPDTHDLNDPLQIVVRDAFETMERQLKRFTEMTRESTQRTNENPDEIGVVTMKNETEGYGFLQTADGRDVYFHENSTLGEFDRIERGTAVRFTEELGEKGPQATTIHIVDKPGVRARHASGNAQL